MASQHTSEEPVEEPARPEQTAAPASPLVLVVEDYQPTRDALADSLEDAGFRVEVADSGREAVWLAIAQKPDIVLMDLSLPGIDGTEATQMLKADARTKNIPVIAVSGNKRRQQEALDAGCVSFVEKPCTIDDVEVRIRALLRGRPPKL